MERNKTQKEVRKDRFNETAQHARELGDRALRDIDAILVEQEEYRAWLEYEGLQPDEVDAELGHWPLPDMHRGSENTP